MFVLSFWHMTCAASYACYMCMSHYGILSQCIIIPFIFTSLKYYRIIHIDNYGLVINQLHCYGIVNIQSLLVRVPNVPKWYEKLCIMANIHVNSGQHER